MTRLTTIDDDQLLGFIFRLSQRRPADDQACDELLGKLLDEADRRGDQVDVDRGRLVPTNEREATRQS